MAHHVLPKRGAFTLFYEEKVRAHEPNVLFCWEYAETSGTNAADSSLAGNAGTHTSGPTVGTAPDPSGLADYSVTYNGVSSRTLTSAALYDWPSNDFTIGWRFKSTGGGGTRVQLYSPDGGTGYLTMFLDSDGDVLMRLYDGTTLHTHTVSADFHVTSDWHSIVTRVDFTGSLFDCWIDGVKETPITITATPAAGAQQIWFGDGNFLAAHAGPLAMPVVFDKLLTDFECSSLYND